MNHEDAMDRTFKALASRERRKILDLVTASPGCCVGDVCAHFDMSRIGVMKHLKILAAAQLIRAEKQGRKRCLWMNSVPIQLIYDRWTTEYSSIWAGRLTRFKYAMEASAQQEETSDGKYGDD